MKNLSGTLVLILISTACFAQEESFEPNQDSVSWYFMQLINELRVSDNLQPLKLNPRLRKFAEQAADVMVQRYPAKPIVTVNRMFGGDHDDFADYIEEIWGEGRWFVENVGVYDILMRNDVRRLQRIRPDPEEYYKLYAEMTRQGPSNKLLAQIAFADWKYNHIACLDVMRAYVITDYYLAIRSTGDKCYFEFIGMNLSGD